MPWDDRPLEISAFGIKQTCRILICSENEDKTRNYDRVHWLAVTFIKLIRFYSPIRERVSRPSVSLHSQKGNSKPA